MDSSGLVKSGDGANCFFQHSRLSSSKFDSAGSSRGEDDSVKMHQDKDMVDYIAEENEEKKQAVRRR